MSIGSGRAAGRLAVIAVAVVLVTAGCLSRSTSKSPTPTSSDATAGDVVGPLAEYRFESAHDAENDFRWRGLEGPLSGRFNASIAGVTGQAVRFVVRHGADPSDQAPHRFRIVLGSLQMAEADADVVQAGDERVLNWTPKLPGNYTYDCTYHPTTQRGLLVVRGDPIDNGTVEPPSGGGPNASQGNATKLVPLNVTLASRLNVLEQNASDLPSLSFRWKGVGGAIDGQLNPVINVPGGARVHFVVRHGSDTGDTEKHKLRVLKGDQVLNASADVTQAGDETSFDWVPAEAGLYRYDCEYHRVQNGTLSVSLVTHRIESARPDALGEFKWRGASGNASGVLNPDLYGSVGTTVRIVAVHGDDEGDAAIVHQLQVVSANAVLGTGDEIDATGEESTVQFAPTQAGTFTYKCTKHPAAQKGNLIIA